MVGSYFFGSSRMFFSFNGLGGSGVAWENGGPGRAGGTSPVVSGGGGRVVLVEVETIPPIGRFRSASTCGWFHSTKNAAANCEQLAKRR